MSGFSDLDASPGVDRLISYLRVTDSSLAAIKAYVAAAARRAVPGGVVLDLGCGLGHDLRRLGEVGVRPVGIDASAERLARARLIAGGVPLVRADAARLPFRDGSLDGCRAERILQHVEAPAVVVAEIARALRPGAFVAVVEPDFATFRVDSDNPDDVSIPGRLLSVRHPRIGAFVAGMLEAAGSVIDDIVTESSRGYSLDCRLPVDAVAAVQRSPTHTDRPALLDPPLRAGFMLRRWMNSCRSESSRSARVCRSND